MSQHLSYMYSMITQSQLNFAVYCVPAIQQTTCFIIITKLLRSMSPHMIVTFILNTKHLKTHAVSLSLLLLIRKKITLWKAYTPFLSILYICFFIYIYICRSQWSRGLRRRSVATRLLRSWVRIPPGTWMFVCCECRVLSGRVLCNELITRPEESY